VKPSQVGVYRVRGMEGYARLRPPFGPDAEYPELGGVGDRDPGNFVFREFRSFLKLLGWDADHYGTDRWNPLGWLVRPGQTVLLKPNLVVSEHPGGDAMVRYTDTDGVLVRCVAEYVVRALAGRGTIVIGDSPIKETDFAKATAVTGIATVAEALRAHTGIRVELVDFRDFVSQRDEVAMVGGRTQAGDARGYTEYDLGAHSELEEVSGQADRFRSTAAYYENRMPETHSPGRHRYSVANSVLDADVFINLPKLKTHCKAGVTVALKNLVGICNEKRWLPHHRQGSPLHGGDEYSEHTALGVKLVERLKDFFVQNPVGKVIYPRIMLANKLGKQLLGIDLIRSIRNSDPYQNGGWYGNDTVWRIVLDLNKILRYGRRDGTLAREPQRRIVTFVDGLWAGELEGPLKPAPKVAGVLLAGVDSLAIDVVAATLMGFDYRKIKLLGRGLAVTDLPLSGVTPDAIEVVSNDAAWSDVRGIGEHHLGFTPPRGWKGHIELEELPPAPHAPRRHPVPSGVA
jgi:uncharacterized protein (DUF362 family)